MGKVSINKDDINRILLTELLPYEVPMLFSNEGLYLNVTNDKHLPFLNRVQELSKAHGEKGRKYGIPFNYEVVKNSEGDTRELSVIHPCNQLLFIQLYKDYSSLMINLCSKSPFSLRKINKVAKFYYSPKFVMAEDGDISAEKEVEPDIIDNETRYLKSFFTYKSIDLIYKFYDSPEYRRLEQRFNHLLEIDISKCFYNIYTHSICWAIKDKESSKRNAKEISFENEFDKLMQLANYNETNGIVVGPEISRIFAEIILQQIDINVYLYLEKKGLKFGDDYEVRRYVDDYFIFSNNPACLETIKKAYQHELKFYKLYLNANKIDTKSTPFISDITVAKRELFHLVDNFFDSYIKVDKDRDELGNRVVQIVHIRKPYYVAQQFIKDFQCIAKRNDLKYDLISKDVLREIKKQLIKIILYKSYVSNSTIENILILLIDLAFYAYSLNINSNTTFKLSQIIVLTSKFLMAKEESLRHSIFSKIHKDADFVLKNYQRKKKSSATNIDTINLLIALKKIGSEYLFSNRKIKDFFDLDSEQGYNNLNYFQIISLLYYIEINPEYDDIKQKIEQAVKMKYANDNDPFSKSELTLLFFDFLCCPFVSDDSKRNVVRLSKYKPNGESNANIDTLISEISELKKWFMDWDLDIDLEKILKKKEWGLTY